MFKSRLLSFLGLSFAFSAIFLQPSCIKDDGKKLVNYDLPMQTGTVIVSIPPTQDSTIAATGVNTYNIDSFIRANTQNLLSLANVQSVEVSSVRLLLSDGASVDNNFANLRTCYASFHSNANKTPFVVPVNDNKDEFATTKDLPVDKSAELKSYLNTSTFHYTVGGQLRRPITDTLKCTIEFRFNIKVQG